MFIQKIQARGLTVGIIAPEVVAWLAEKPFERLELELQQWAFVDVAVAVHTDLPARARLVIGLVVLHSIGLNDKITPAQLRCALDDGLKIRAAVQALTADKDRQVPGHLGRNQFLQLAAALDRQDGLNRLRTGYQHDRLSACPARLQDDYSSKPPDAVVKPVLEIRQRRAHRQTGLAVGAVASASGEG